MKNYWNSLNDREQWMVALTIIVLTIYLVYLFIFAPLNHAIVEKSAQLIEKRNTLDWMQQAKHQKHTARLKKTLSNSQLLTLLSGMLKTNPLKGFNYQIEQTSTGDIQLSYNEVSFNQFITWLKHVNNNYAVNIKQLNVERAETSGIVKLLLIISA